MRPGRIVLHREHGARAGGRRGAVLDGMVADVRGRFAITADFERQLEAEGSSEEELREGYRERIKEKLDPQGIMSPGRYLGGL